MRLTDGSRDLVEGVLVGVILGLIALCFIASLGCSTSKACPPCPPPDPAEVISEETWACPEPPTFARVDLPNGRPMPQCDFADPVCISAVNLWLVEMRDVIAAREMILNDEINARDAALERYRSDGE
jgi:hypothetical protein